MPPASQTIRVHARGAAGALVFEFVHRALRISAVGVSFFALLAPLTAGAIPLLFDQPSTCSMSCCKGLKSCCCHLQNNAGRIATVWTASGKCPIGCSQRAGLQGLHAFALPSLRIAVGLIAPSDVLRDCSPEHAANTHTDFALFGRPPPPSI